MSEQQWISVDSNLPELDQVVWLWNGESCWIGCRSHVPGEGWFWCDCEKPSWNAKKNAWSCDVSDMDDYQVTHWAKLITPPVCLGCGAEGTDTQTCDRCGKQICDNCSPERDDDSPIDICEECCARHP